MDAVLVAEEVRRTFGETVALDGVSLSVGAGEVFSLVGPNGAGKTTLVRTLTGTIDHEGSVSLFGDHPRSVDRSRIGLLPQSFAPPARLSARELVSYYAGLYDESRPVDEVLADVGLSDTADTRYENLSGGQQRRTCVGIALVNDPELLVLDEPTTGIDPVGRRALWGLLSGLAASGTTILLTTHYMEEAEHLADRVGLLANGRMATTGTPAELVAEHGGPSRLVIELADDATADGSTTGPATDAATTDATTAPATTDGTTAPTTTDATTVSATDGADPATNGTATTDTVGPSDARATTTETVVRALTDAGFDASADSDDSVGAAPQSAELVVRDVAPERIGDVVDALDAADAEYGGLAWSQPDLEDVYLALTGTSMGAGDSPDPNRADADGPTGDHRPDDGAAATEEASGTTGETSGTTGEARQ